MEITEVRIKLTEDPHDRLQGFCSITIDECFVIRDLKIIRGTKGLFVAMPSRKLTDRCPRCNTKNHLRANYCNQCGAKLRPDRAEKDETGRAKLYADIAHPINPACREKIQSRVLEEFEKEKIRAQQPGYRSSYDALGDEDFEAEQEEAELVVDAQQQPSTDSHRIEPAAEQAQPQPPHVTQQREQRAESTSEGDEFGAGVV